MGAPSGLGRGGGVLSAHGDEPPDTPAAGGQAELAEAYSDTCLRRVWRATHFSWWMTSMLHVDPHADQFGATLQLSQLRYVISSRAAATTLAENYTGYYPLHWP